MRRGEAAIAILVREVEAGRERLAERHVTVNQRRDLTERIDREILGLFMVFSLKVEEVEPIVDAKLLEQPAGARGASTGGKVQLHL